MRDPADDFTPIESIFVDQVRVLDYAERHAGVEQLGRELERALARRELAEAIAQELTAA